MNILIVLNGWLTKISGGDYHILRVAQFWNKNNKIYYLLPRLGYENIRNSDLLIGKPIIIETPFEKETNNIFKIIFLYIHRIIKAILLKPKYKFDVIIASSHFLYDTIPAIILSKKCKSRMIVYFHGLIHTYRKTNSFRNIVSKINEIISIILIKKFADKIFVINKSIFNSLIKFGINPSKITTTKNGIDCMNINNSNEIHKKYDFCFCGRLTKLKGVYDLIDIIEYIIKVIKDKNVKLAIIGDGEELHNLKKYIKHKGLQNNVILLGAVFGEEKSKIFLSSKIFLLPSYEETWGIVIGEALVHGLPVICYELPIIKSIWRDTVIWVPKGNKEKFAEKAVMLLHDKKFRKKVINKAKLFVKKYSWEKIAELEIKEIEKIR